MKKFVFRDGIYTLFRPLYYLCKVFGLASFRRKKRLTPDYGYLNYILTVIWLIVFGEGLPYEILKIYSSVFGSQTLFIAFTLYYTSSYTSSVVAVVWISVIKEESF